MIIHSFAGFVDMGSCVLHVVHNAFGKGLEKYGKEVDQLCLDLHAIFKHSSARREDYQQLQFDMGVELHTFQQHTEVWGKVKNPIPPTRRSTRRSTHHRHTNQVNSSK